MRGYLILEATNKVEIADEIVVYLNEMGGDTEHHSISKDIEEIDKITWMIENGEHSNRQ